MKYIVKQVYKGYYCSREYRRAKGRHFENETKNWLLSTLDTYKQYGLRYRLEHSKMDEHKADLRLNIKHGYNTIRKLIECKNWATHTEKGKPVTVNWKNYLATTHAEKAGTSKFDGYEGYERLLLFKNKLEIRASAKRLAVRDGVQILHAETFEDQFIREIDDLVHEGHLYVNDGMALPRGTDEPRMAELVGGALCARLGLAMGNAESNPYNDIKEGPTDPTVMRQGLASPVYNGMIEGLPWLSSKHKHNSDWWMLKRHYTYPEWCSLTLEEQNVELSNFIWV